MLWLGVLKKPNNPMNSTNPTQTIGWIQLDEGSIWVGLEKFQLDQVESGRGLSI